MVQYVGHVTSDGELIVQLDGNPMSLREFLDTTRIGNGSRQGSHEDRRQHDYEDGEFVAAK